MIWVNHAYLLPSYPGNWGLVRDKEIFLLFWTSREDNYWLWCMLWRNQWHDGKLLGRAHMTGWQGKSPEEVMLDLWSEAWKKPSHVKNWGKIIPVHRNRDRSRDGKEAQVAQQWAWQGVEGVEVGEGSWAKSDSRALIQRLGCFLRAVGSHWTSGRWVPASHGRPRVLNRCTCLIRPG